LVFPLCSIVVNVYEGMVACWAAVWHKFDALKRILVPFCPVVQSGIVYKACVLVMLSPSQSNNNMDPGE
jgi:hypothetical protein